MGIKGPVAHFMYGMIILGCLILPNYDEAVQILRYMSVNAPSVSPYTRFYGTG